MYLWEMMLHRSQSRSEHRWGDQGDPKYCFTGAGDLSFDAEIWNESNSCGPNKGEVCNEIIESRQGVASWLIHKEKRPK